jgi:hypothetical protein
MSLLDVGIPLALFYGLRLLGVNQWLALVLSGALPVVRLIYRIVKDHKVEALTLFSLSILVSSTVLALAPATGLVDGRGLTPRGRSMQPP